MTGIMAAFLTELPVLGSPPACNAPESFLISGIDADEFHNADALIALYCGSRL
jgi:hypothetical protein